MIPSLRTSLESAQATVTAEAGPPRGADPGAMRRKVEHLADGDGLVKKELERWRQWS